MLVDLTQAEGLRVANRDIVEVRVAGQRLYRKGPSISLVAGSGYEGSTYAASIAGQWTADGVPIAGETGLTLSNFSAEHVGKVLRCGESNGIKALMPGDVAPSLLWFWDALDGSTVTLDTGVSAWTDRVSGKVLAQATAGSQPPYVADAGNGHPGISLNGGKTLRLSGNTDLLGAAERTIFVSKIGNIEANISTIFWYGGAGDATWSAFGFILQGGENNAYIDMYHVELWFPFFHVGTQVLLGIVSDGNIAETHADGLLGFAYNDLTPETAGDQIVIGGWTPNSGAIPNNTTVQMVCAYSTALTTEQRRLYEGIESWRLGRAGLNLPADHPYRTKPPLVSYPY